MKQLNTQVGKGEINDEIKWCGLRWREDQLYIGKKNEARWDETKKIHAVVQHDGKRSNTEASLRLTRQSPEQKDSCWTAEKKLTSVSGMFETLREADIIFRKYAENRMECL